MYEIFWSNFAYLYILMYNRDFPVMDAPNTGWTLISILKTNSVIVVFLKNLNDWRITHIQPQMEKNNMQTIQKNKNTYLRRDNRLLPYRLCTE